MTAPAPFDPVPPVGTGDPRRPTKDVAAWVASAPVRALVELFARGPADRALARDLATARSDVADRLARLEAYSARWDTRRGRERDQAGTLEVTPTQRAAVAAAAKALGMCGDTRPRFARYDHLLILGGSLRGCVARPAYAAELVRSGRVVAGEVTALGGHRPFSAGERRLAAVAGAPQLSEEYEALDHCTRRAFGRSAPTATAGAPGPLTGDGWRIRCYAADAGADAPPVRVVAAPSRAPAVRRANTADTYAFFAARVAALRPGTRLLVVTSAINVPAQHATAVRLFALPYGAVVDTLGTPARSTPEPLAHRPGHSEYLQEIRSTIRALHHLVRGEPAGSER